eukprot:CAMPEP_0179129890 /NCGR_PEP_ID=MMETSP0796-20121207/61645_1 /TAXON_ID=73915 /ORGANISM="Pyrodinium bahamense, Strain pbaha01" /LENGTH=401 /DNA_ID=CAMNT_0020828779 /DNA_START=1 /DNA_END=1206 /DNA_ORIENTATION=-
MSPPPALALLAFAACLGLVRSMLPAALVYLEDEELGGNGTVAPPTERNSSRPQNHSQLEPLAPGGNSSAGCCFVVSLAPAGALRRAPCCLRTERLDRRTCFRQSAATGALPPGTVAGWTSTCPGSALEASEWVQDASALASSAVGARNASDATSNATTNASAASDASASQVAERNSSAADNRSDVNGSSASGASNASNSSVECRTLPNHTTVTDVLDTGGDPDGTDPEGPFANGTVVEVYCSPGFNGSRRSWEIACSAKGQWQAHEEIPDAQEDSAMPDCREKPCTGPPDLVGTWQRRGQDLHLVCVDGYVPDDGTPAVPCYTENHELNPAHCVPSEGHAQKWRMRLRRQAFFSLIGVAAIVVSVLAACWRSPSRTVMRPTGERMADGLVERGAMADFDME